MPTRHERQAYWTESERRDGHGDVELEDRQSYRQRYMTGKDGKEGEEYQFRSDNQLCDSSTHPIANKLV